MKSTRDTVLLNYPSTWWQEPWREGLVSGNGQLGINVHGGNQDEVLVVNHNDLWTGSREQELPDISSAFTRQRELIDSGEFPAASWVLADALRDAGYGDPPLESLLPLGALKVKLKQGSGFAGYSRYMQMNTGEVGARWQDGLSHVESTQFVSRANGLIVKRIRSDGGEIDVDLSFDAEVNGGVHPQSETEHRALKGQQRSRSGEYLSYYNVNDDGRTYGMVARVVTGEEGVIRWQGHTMSVSGVRELVVLIRCFVNAHDANDQITSASEYLGTTDSDYEALLESHTRLHEKLYRSATLELSECTGRSSEELLLEAHKGVISAELIEKQWKFGRYLFISGSSEQSNPFGMYGLWAGDYDLPWCHMMSNINLQMMYWHAPNGNLIDFAKAVPTYYNGQIDTLRENATKIFGMRGIFMTSGTTPNVFKPSQVVPVIINWVHAAGWISQHYIALNRYLHDKEYLKQEVLPFLLEVAHFYEDFVTFDHAGMLRLYPSVSPENVPGNFMPPAGYSVPHAMPTTVNSTIDLAIVKEFFTELLGLAQEVPLDSENVDLWNKIVDAVPEYAINADGGIKEWQDDRFEERYEHRHLSHIYPVFPGTEINDLNGAEKLPNFKRAVDLRRLDAQTGWSMAMMASIYARLEDGEAASAALGNLARSCLLPNLLTLHNDWRGMNLSWTSPKKAPVQLDAAIGVVNAIQEMVLYVSDDLLKLLPALPEQMHKGRIAGFRSADASIDIEWDVARKRMSAKVRAVRRHSVTIKLPAYLDLNKLRIETSGGDVQSDGRLLKLDMEAGGEVSVSV